MRSGSLEPPAKAPDSWLPLVLGGLALLLLQGAGHAMKENPLTGNEDPAYLTGRLMGLFGLPCALAFFAFLTGLRVVKRGAGWQGASGCGTIIGAAVLLLLGGSLAAGALIGRLRTPAPLPPRVAPAAVPEAAARAFALELERAYAARDPFLLNQRLDVDGLLRRLDVAIARDPGFRKGAREAYASGAFGAGLMKAVDADQGTVELLRLRTRDGQTTALFRVIGAQGGLNYHELWLVQRPDGTVAYDDMLAFNGCARMSELAARLAEDERVTRNLTAVMQPLKQGQPQEALKAYRRLPADLQDRLDVLVIRHMAAQQVGGGELAGAVSALEQYSTEPGVSLLLLGVYVDRGEDDRGLAALDAIDRAVGGDPWLDLLRAQVEKARGDLAKAKRLATAAAAAAPTQPAPLWVLVEVALAQDDHAVTADLVRRLTRIGAPPDLDHPAFARFRASPEGIAPVESR